MEQSGPMETDYEVYVEFGDSTSNAIEQTSVEEDPKRKLFEIFNAYHIFLFSGELDELYEEIEMDLRESQTRSKTDTHVWQQRMERREEAWESARTAIFEIVVKGEGLPDNNVLHSYINLSTYLIFNDLGMQFLWKDSFYTVLSLWLKSFDVFCL